MDATTFNLGPYKFPLKQLRSAKNVTDWRGPLAKRRPTHVYCTSWQQQHDFRAILIVAIGTVNRRIVNVTACLAYSQLEDSIACASIEYNNSAMVLHSFMKLLEWCVFFFLLERPNLFAICNNTFSKWWEGWRMSCRRVLSSTLLLVRGSTRMMKTRRTNSSPISFFLSFILSFPLPFFPDIFLSYFLSYFSSFFSSLIHLAFHSFHFFVYTSVSCLHEGAAYREAERNLTVNSFKSTMCTIEF
jgi:hypothetical protein